MKIHLHKGDLPSGLKFGPLVAIDTETMGLNPLRDRLCLVQLTDGNGECHLVQFKGCYSAPNLKVMLADSAITKIFHFARFDVAMMIQWLEIVCAPVFCTKIASKLCRTNTDKHGLKDLCKDLLGAEIAKQQQTSDWGADTLSSEQLNYAASDVIHLHKLKEKMDILLEREGRTEIAAACFRFLPTKARLDLMGWEGENDIFEH